MTPAGLIVNLVYGFAVGWLCASLVTHFFPYWDTWLQMVVASGVGITIVVLTFIVVWNL